MTTKRRTNVGSKRNEQATQGRVSREVWIDRIADHVLTQGVSNLSVRTLAAHFGVTAQALLNHFDSKEILVQEASLRALHRDRLILETMLNNMQSVDQFLDDLLKNLARPSFRRLFAFQVELYATAANDPRQFSFFAERSTKTNHHIFEHQARRDGIPDDQVEAVSGMVMTVARGLIIEAIGGRESGKLRAVADRLLEWYTAQIP